MISVHFQDKPFNITVIQAYAPTTRAEEAEVDWFYEYLQDLERTNTQKGCPFHHRGLKCKSRKSRDTWNNRQIWLWSTKGSRSKANRVLPREHTGHSKHPLQTTQEKTWTSPDGQHRNQIDYILCSQRWRRKRQPTPVFLPEESQDRGAWWAAIYGVTQSWTRLKRLSLA